MAWENEERSQEFSGVSAATLPFVNITDYGVVANGVTDVTDLIQEAIDDLPVTGGVILFPAGVYLISDTITIGDGTSTSNSTRVGIHLIGAGSDGYHSDAGWKGGGTRFAWAGASGSGPMMDIKGPIANVLLRGFTLDCNALANVGLRTTSMHHSEHDDILVFNQRTDAFLYEAHQHASLPSLGTSRNVFSRCNATFPALDTSNAYVLGSSDYTAPGQNVHGNVWMRCTARVGATGGAATGSIFVFNYTDANTFIQCDSPANFGRGITVNVPASRTDFPGGMTFINCQPNGPTVVNGTWAGENGFYFLPYGKEGSSSLPTNVNPLKFAGFSTDGNKWFGAVRGLSLRNTAITSSSAIANTAVSTAFDKSFTLAAGQVNIAGTLIRVKASGVYSTTGAPTIIFRILFGGNSTGAAGAFTTANNAASLPWTYSQDIIIRTTGAAGTAKGVCGMMGLGTAPIPFAPASSITQVKDLTATQVVSCAIQWGTADPANTITMESFTVEVMYSDAAA